MEWNDTAQWTERLQRAVMDAAMQRQLQGRHKNQSCNRSVWQCWCPRWKGHTPGKTSNTHISGSDRARNSFYGFFLNVAFKCHHQATLQPRQTQRRLFSAASLFWQKTSHWLDASAFAVYYDRVGTNVIVIQSMLTGATTYKPAFRHIRREQTDAVLRWPSATLPTHRRDQLELFTSGKRFEYARGKWKH